MSFRDFSLHHRGICQGEEWTDLNKDSFGGMLKMKS